MAGPKRRPRDLNDERARLALRLAQIITGVWLASIGADAVLGDAFTPPDGIQHLMALAAGYLFAANWLGGAKKEDTRNGS